ncbi:nitrate reductase associated protein [Parasediminibacterium sp. JCM 36343]|uniref:nitrate reductase associated protein n=1 Tax=Parasediminibacterium sp. JCM 36343 TaxID=3374279 RepID=UPI00397B6FC4
MNQALNKETFIAHPSLGAGATYFYFEADFIKDNIRCIPMCARFKLDAAGIKFKLKDWCNISVTERNTIAEYDCNTVDKLKSYKAYLQELIFSNTGMEAKELRLETTLEWDETDTMPPSVVEKCSEFSIPFSIENWRQLNELQRFALIKLSKSAHENKNFPLAMKEFGVV